MSFINETRNELAREIKDKQCCMLAEIAGFVRASGSIMLEGFGNFKIVLETETPAVARYIKTLMQAYFGIETTLEIKKQANLKKNNIYTITIEAKHKSNEILRETGILMTRTGYNYITDGIYQNIIKKKCCKKSYLKGLFLACGTMSDPEKSYHIEFVTRSEVLAKDITRLINSFVDISPKMTKRKKEYVIYLKDSNQIMDMLAIMGANNQYFKMQDIKMRKEIKNHANRINNCDQANIDKAITAASKHIANIQKIDENMGIDSLPEKLRVVAYARMENPYVSLVELGEMMEPPLSKSGVNKRLSKIADIANEL